MGRARSHNILSSEWAIEGSEHNVEMRMRVTSDASTNADVFVSATGVLAMPFLTNLSSSFNPLPPHSSVAKSFFVLFSCQQESVVETWFSNGLIVRSFVVETWS